MLLEQNLFCIYRIILKIPRAVYVLLALLLIFLAATQIIYIHKINKTHDFSPLLFEYVMQKHEQRAPLNISTISNETAVNATTNNKSME